MTDGRHIFTYVIISAIWQLFSRGSLWIPEGIHDPFMESAESNYFHNNTKMWSAFFTVLTHALILKKH